MSVLATYTLRGSCENCARGRPIIVEWERRKAFGGPLSFAHDSNYLSVPSIDVDAVSLANAKLKNCHQKSTLSRLSRGSSVPMQSHGSLVFLPSS
ncbi:hypothetical protein EVAR_51051_1 [Eumeta japonica]|uniref:Uncharacterized protein n=1 Tax=Eumeta variegata TaxID=151549 RepID=A0A4C1ZB97_EUMVA|nr:hypothetical protein EVAR_51051_1 [Eumeta japonica]